MLSGVESRVLFIGPSTDNKPQGEVDFGAKFYEQDTFKTYIWTGYANSGAPGTGIWIEYAPMCPTIIAELTNTPAKTY